MKRIKLISLILVALSFSVGNGFGQSKAPGYLGKRFLFGYKFHVIPGWGKSPSNNAEFDPDQNSSFKFNTFHEGFIEAVLSRRSTIVMKGLFSSGQFQTDIGNDEYYYYGSTSNIETEWGAYNSIGGGLGIRLFTKHLAPLGNYIGVSMGWQQVKTQEYTFLESESTFNSNHIYESRTIAPTSGGTVYMGFELGTNHILFDRLILNVSLETNLFVSSLFNLPSLVDDYQYFESEEDYEKEVVQSALGRLQQKQLLSIGIGIGFLP